MKIITITASDGKKFEGNDYFALDKEVNAYEADLKLKKEKEEAAKSKSEKAFKEIIDIVEQLNTAINEYEMATGEQTYFATLNRRLIIKKSSALNGFIKEYFGL
jgi:molecular chaperone GrpE (heat shock protein)